VSEATGLPVQKFFSGPQGGLEQINSRISCNEVDLVLFFRDTISPEYNPQSDQRLLRLCDVHNVPVATNMATAEVLIHGLERGDLDWRDIVNPVRPY